MQVHAGAEASLPSLSLHIAAITHWLAALVAQRALPATLMVPAR
jgi:hypothetical protein